MAIPGNFWENCFQSEFVVTRGYFLQLMKIEEGKIFAWKLSIKKRWTIRLKNRVKILYIWWKIKKILAKRIWNLSLAKRCDLISLFLLASSNTIPFPTPIFLYNPLTTPSPLKQTLCIILQKYLPIILN